MVDGLAELGALALGNRLKRISDCLLYQGTKVYQIAGVDFEPRWFPAYSYLYRHGPTSITALARGLGVSHPAVNKIANELIEARLVAPYRDRNDKRKRVLALTSLGRGRYYKLEPLWREIRQSLQSLLDDAGGEFLRSLTVLESSLADQDLVERFEQRWHGGYRQEILIRAYQSKFDHAFKSLNEAWISQHFELQAFDTKLLVDPQSCIADQGDEILFAVDSFSEEVLGTAALLRRDDDLIELAYMTVASHVRGRQIGMNLGETVVSRCRELGAAVVCLFTNRLLNPSINLYSRLGFEEKPPLGGMYNSWADIYMELEL